MLNKDLKVKRTFSEVEMVCLLLLFNFLFFSFENANRHHCIWKAKMFSHYAEQNTESNTL